ncbi:MAG: hypothetical protein QNK37_07450 [Acidobacteriota bacterium]|nr:hypothetical protein [Acidobacteriota bacterium]
MFKPLSLLILLMFCLTGYKAADINSPSTNVNQSAPDHRAASRMTAVSRSNTWRTGHWRDWKPSGSVSYVISDFDILETFDITDPANPRKTDQLYLQVAFLDWTAGGGHAFLGTEAGVIVYETDMAGKLRKVGRFGHDIECRYVSFDDNLLFLSDDFETSIFDITNIAAPQLLTVMPARHRDFKVEGTLGVGLQGNFWVTYDMTDLSNPVFGNIIISPGQLELVGNTAYVDNGSVYIYDLTEYDNPVSSDFPGGVTGWSMAAMGNRLYRRGSSSIEVLDITDPASITATVSGLTNVNQGDMVAQDGFLFISSFDRLTVLSLADPDNPVRVYDHSNGDLTYVSRDDGQALVSMENERLYVLDVSSGNKIEEKASFAIDGATIAETFIQSGTAYLADLDHGLRIFDISDPAMIQELGDVPLTLPGPRHVQVADGFAYLIHSMDRISIVNVQGARAFVTEIVLPSDDVRNLIVRDGVGYIVGASGLHTYDLSNPAAPAFITTLPDAAGFNDLALKGNTLYVSTPSDIKVIDVTDPAMPMVVNTYTNFDENTNLAVTNDWLVNGYQRKGVEFIDISNPTQPVFQSSIARSRTMYPAADDNDVLLGFENGPEVGRHHSYCLWTEDAGFQQAVQDWPAQTNLADLIQTTTQPCPE